MPTKEQFLNYFFRWITANDNFHVYDIQDVFMNPLETNVLLCVENCAYWGTSYGYKHWVHYGEFGNPYVSLYLYNHINRCVITATYIAVPVIYLQMSYMENYARIPIPTIPWEHKKFCLIATLINNADKKRVYAELITYGPCDSIIDMSGPVKNASCYHSLELLEVFNQYKFVFVAENSIHNGYITEKIFNCFFARVIPIYLGPPDQERYFNQDCYIRANDLGTIKDLVHDSTAYHKVLSNPSVKEGWDDEHYLTLLRARYP